VGVDWIDLSQDSGQWRAVVNTAMNFNFPLNVYTEKTKYMLLSRQQNAGQNHDIKIRN
jgi:hypothetical protein